MKLYGLRVKAASEPQEWNYLDLDKGNFIIKLINWMGNFVRSADLHLIYFFYLQKCLLGWIIGLVTTEKILELRVNKANIRQKKKDKATQYLVFTFINN